MADRLMNVTREALMQGIEQARPGNNLYDIAAAVQKHAEAAGFPRLSRAGKSTIWRILEENRLKPHKIAYYLEKRDPDFDRKMHEILMVCISTQLNGRSAIQELSAFISVSAAWNREISPWRRK